MILRPAFILSRVFLSAVPLLGGCVTILNSERATDTAQGMRYSLPVPILKVTPQGDGTMGVEVFYIPDPNNTYVVQAKSLLGSYTLDVKTNQGLLDTVTFNPDSTGVAEQAINSYGDIQKGKIEAQAKADEAATKKADEKAKEAADAATAIRDAQTALDVATAKRDKLVDLKVGGDQEVAAELAIVEAEQKLHALQANAAADAVASSMNKAANSAKTFDKAAGPVFYRLEPDSIIPGKVNLVDAFQVKEESAKPVKPGPPPPPLAYEIVGSPIVRPGKDGLALRVRINQKFDSVDPGSIALTAIEPVNPVTKPTIVKADEGYLQVILDDQQASGTYKLDFALFLDKEKKRHGQANGISFEIRPKMGK